MTPKCITALLLTLWVATAASQPREVDTGGGYVEPAPVRLEKWHYRWGDSPRDAAGRFLWLQRESPGPIWRPISSMTAPPGGEDQGFAWYHIRLPRERWINPTLYFPSVAMAFEVYIDTTRIYKFGQMKPVESNKYGIVTNHLIPLQDEYQGGMLTVRVYSSDVNIIGIGKYEEDVWIGSDDDLVRNIFHSSAESTLMGLMFIFVGLFSALFSVRRSVGGGFFSFSFGTFAFFIGLFFVFSDPVADYLIRSPVVKLYGRFCAYLIFPIGLYIFLQQITGPSKLTKSLWMLHLAAVPVVLLLDVFGVVPLPLSFMPFSYFFMGTIVVAAYLALRAAIGGNRNARIFVWGFTALCLTGLHDILVGMGQIPFWRWMSHWGALVFIICLAYILAQRFAESHRRLKSYSIELEQKSEELQEYSRTLERRVAERTKDLDAKNKELEHTLGQLREAQQQLVLKEKMASLGDLVAGVAHEMNNPVAAINSAADVSSRCLERIEEMVGGDKPVESVWNDKRYQTAMQLLKENTRIVVEGSSRVTRIIRSLKNFARLDEAELQEADIHQGIESTLTLLHHELKDNVEVVKDFGDIPKIKCYPNQLNQVFMNLFINAAHAIDDNGIIEINTRADENNVYIRVADNGKGIPREYLDKIFDPGFTTKGAGVGTGLGLSISYNIIQKHGGTLKVQSEEGSGTEFIITLPRKASPSPGA